MLRVSETASTQKKRLRHELKYLINIADYYNLRSRVEVVAKKDVNAAKDGYHVRSLYFDDMYNNSYDEKIYGIMHREKYRIRIYNKSNKIIKLERKLKIGDRICKESFLLSKDEFYDIINKNDFSAFNDMKNSLRTDFFLAARTRLLKPAVIVDYMREAFVMREGNVRITFDKELKSGYNTYDIFDDNIAFASCYPPGTLLLEVKYDNYLPETIRSVLKIDSNINLAMSKYVVCREKQYMFINS